MSEGVRPSTAKIVAAFLAVYLIWGSTYLAIAVAVESLPPFLMASARFLASGVMLFAWSTLRGAPLPSRRQWREAAVVGTLLLLGGNGAVAWSEQRVPSGVASLLVATVPLWMVLLGWLWKGGERPDWRVWSGVALGLTGVAVLIGPEALGVGRVDTRGGLALLFGSFAWAVGSLYSRSADLPESPLLATGTEMLTGGAALGLFSLVTGEAGAFAPHAVTGRSLVALGYLVTIGSLVGFTAYIWLLRNATPARVATYAYVNPVVAVFLGWLVRGEPLGRRTLASAGVVLVAVALITARTAAAQTKDE